MTYPFSWDGTDGHLVVAGTLNVEGSGETLAKFIDDGAVELYHNNVKKFETTASGVTLTGELQTTGFLSSDFAAAFIVIEDGGTDGSGTDAGDNIIIEDGGTDGAGANAGDDLLMENVTSWVTSGFTIRDGVSWKPFADSQWRIVMTVRRPIVYDAGPGKQLSVSGTALSEN